MFSRYREHADIIDDVNIQLTKSIEYFYNKWKKSKGSFTNLLISFDRFTSPDSFGYEIYKTRNIETGEPGLNGSFSLGDKSNEPNADNISPIAKIGEDALSVLADIARKLEVKHKTPQEIEFQYIFGDVGVCQVRSIQITEYSASLRLAIDYAKEQIAPIERPLKLFDFEKVKNTLVPDFDEGELSAAQEKFFTKGTSQAPFPGTGNVIFSLDSLTKHDDEDEEAPSAGYVYYGKTFKIDDIELILQLKGLLLSEGEINPEVISFANFLKIPIITNLENIKYSSKNKTLTSGENVLNEGDPVSLNGEDGQIYASPIPVNTPSFNTIPDLSQLISWSDEIRKTNNFSVFVSVDSTEELDLAGIGADGIGLYRSEQAFLTDRVAIIQKLIIEQNPEEKENAKADVESAFSGDFSVVFECSNTSPCFIRLFDAPINLFLPDLGELEEEIQNLKKAQDEEEAAPEEEDLNELKEKEELYERVKSFAQTNPLMGCRGVRLLDVIPDFLEIQLKALIEASFAAADRLAEEISPVILVPFVVSEKELENIKQLIDKLTIPIAKEHEVKATIKIGVLIELPRACLIADKLAPYVDYIVFNLDLLQQTAFGISEEDTKTKLVPRYCSLNLFKKSPFESLDIPGIGKFINFAVEKIKATGKNVQIGVCGPHCAEFESNAFLQSLGVSFVSVPKAQLDFARLFSTQVILQKYVEPN